MKKLMLFIILLLAACSATPTPVIIPTVAVLPTLPPSATTTPSPSAQPSTATTTLTPTLVPTTDTPTDQPPTSTATTPPSATSSLTNTLSPSQTLTPSLTITNTITPTPSQTFTPTVEMDGLGMLAMLMERATILPPELLYNPATLTAVFYAGETLVAAGFASSPTPVLGTPAVGAPILGTIGAPTTSATCVSPPPGSLATADPNLTQSVGCPQGLFFSTLTAIQTYEHGSMIYVQGIGIYVVTLDGRFRRFDDTWVSGVDPETGGETPPLGLIEPKRGFGKIWRNNPDVRAALGWAVTDEQGSTSDVQLFERGRAVFLPQRGETILFIDDPGGLSGMWRALAASF